MPKSIEQSNTGTAAIQIGCVNGNVTIIQHQPAPRQVDGKMREASLALGGIALLFVGVSLATPITAIQMAAYLLGDALAFTSLFNLYRATQRWMP